MTRRASAYQEPLFGDAAPSWRGLEEAKERAFARADETSARLRARSATDPRRAADCPGCEAWGLCVLHALAAEGGAVRELLPDEVQGPDDLESGDAER